MPADTLYEDDIVAWAEQQAQAIRELSRMRPELSNVLDWDHVAEEIEGVAQDFFYQFTGLTRQFLIHLAKALSAPQSPSLPHWGVEASNFHDDAIDRFTQSMRQKVNVDELWARALKQAKRGLAAHGDALAQDLPPRCPLTLDELVDPEMDLDKAVSIASVRLGRIAQPITTLS